jgi:hypothetical protein
MTVAWAIWIHINNIIFNNASMCLVGSKHEFRELFFLYKYRAKPSLESATGAWLASL